MASACERMDELVKDYLTFRGFTTTVKSLDIEIKHDKDKGLRADKILEQLMSYIWIYDLQRLREYWAYLNQRFFSRLEHRYFISVRKLEVSVLKFYIINAQQNNRQDRVRDFFEKFGPELQNQLEFRDWFVFQFLPNPAENTNFALYFTRQWQETVQLSLHNFLQVILQAMPIPALLNFDHEARQMQSLQEENESLRKQITSGVISDKKIPRMKASEQSSTPQPLPDLIYDFSGLADSQEGATETVTERQKFTRRFPINLSAPLLKRKSQTSDTRQQQDSTGGNQQPSGHGNQSANNSNTDSNSVAVSQQQTAGVPQASSVPGQNIAALTTTYSVAACAAIASSLPTGGVQRSSIGGRGSSIVQTVSAVVSSQKKAPRELTSFPPQQLEKSDAPPPPTMQSQPQKAGSSGPVSERAAASQAQAQSQVEGRTAGAKSELAPVQETSSAEAQSTAMLYGPPDPLLPISEEQQCPFLVLSDDEYQEHRSAVCYSRFSLSGQHVASLDVAGVVKVWTWSPQPSTVATVMSRAPFLSLDWASKSDRWLLIGNQSGQIRLFDARENKTFREASVESPYVRVTYLSTCTSTMSFASCLSTSPASSEAGTETGKLALWDLKTMKMERYLPIEPSPVSISCCTYSADGKLLLAGGADGVVRLYDVAQRQCVRTWKAGLPAVQTLQFAHHEASFFTMGPQGTLCEWSLARTGRPLRQVAIGDTTMGLSAPQQGSGGGVATGQLFSLSKDKGHLLCSLQRKGVICKVGDGQSKSPMHRLLDLSPHADLVTTVDWSLCLDTPVCLTGARDGHLKVATLLVQ